jgi:RNase P/RNase MRP subunit p30
MRHVDLYTGIGCVEQEKRMGWDRTCAVAEYKGKGEFKKYRENAVALGDDVLVGALISGDARKNARKALDAQADVIIADGRIEDACRTASECWEVDLIVNPELTGSRDLLDQWSSGLDHVMASFMAERGIGYCVNTANILDAAGVKRARLLGRIMQNLRLARKYRVNIVFATGARDKWSIRSPSDLAQLAKTLGLPDAESRKTVSQNPLFYVKRASERNNPDILTKGLEVVDWGSQQRKPKRKYGWY